MIVTREVSRRGQGGSVRAGEEEENFCGLVDSQKNSSTQDVVG